MRFFRVKKEYDNCKRIDGSVLVKNEIYTEKEVRKFKIPLERLVECEEKKNNTYWMFGARFSNNLGYSD